MDAPTPSLLSESPAEREALARRLINLREDPRLRARHAALLRSAWDSIRAVWPARTKAVAEAAVDWRRRLASGEPFREVLRRQHLWPGRPELDDIADAAAAEGRLVLTPCWYGGEVHAVELDGTVYLGRGVQRLDGDHSRIYAAKSIAGQLKALADPTRVAILLTLAEEPASVTELARRFDLSQPTISGHVQLLREAGLLEEKPAGRSMKLSASEAKVRRLIQGAEAALVNFYRR